MRQVAANEIKADSSNERFEYRETKQTPSGTTALEVVETKDGSISRKIESNGEPLSEDQQKKEDSRLQRLVNDPQAMQKHVRSQQEDEARVRKMLAALPDAFLYQYDGAEPSQYGPLARLRFKPNPSFNPPNRETEIYRGMEGTMLVDPREKRLVEMNADLFQQVSFGWGFFGHLDKGGHFIVKQSKISPTRWETTGMDLKFTGRILLFKKLNINEQDTESDFHSVAPNLTLEQGIALLHQQAHGTTSAQLTH